MSTTRKRHFVRLIPSCLIHLLSLMLHPIPPEVFSILESIGFVSDFPPHPLWTIRIADMIQQIIPTGNNIPLRSWVLFASRFHPLRKIINCPTPKPALSLPTDPPIGR